MSGLGNPYAGSAGDDHGASVTPLHVNMMEDRAPFDSSEDDEEVEQGGPVRVINIAADGDSRVSVGDQEDDGYDFTAGYSDDEVAASRVGARQRLPPLVLPRSEHEIEGRQRTGEEGSDRGNLREKKGPRTSLDGHGSPKDVDRGYDYRDAPQRNWPEDRRRYDERGWHDDGDRRRPPPRRGIFDDRQRQQYGPPRPPFRGYQGYNGQQRYPRQQPPPPRSFGCGRKVLAIVIGALIAFLYAGRFALPQGLSEPLYPAYRFNMQDEGVPVAKAVPVTEAELSRGLFKDIPIERLGRDLTTHIRNHEYGSCMCMHHLHFMHVQNSRDITPRRFCVVFNRRRNEAEVLVNPEISGRSESVTSFLQKSRGCRKEDLPVRVERPDSLFLRWADPILDYTKPEGKRMRYNFAKFSGPTAACLALALEEIDGKMRCKVLRAGAVTKVTNQAKIPKNVMPNSSVGAPVGKMPKPEPLKTLPVQPPAKSAVVVTETIEEDVRVSTEGGNDNE